MEIFAYEYGPPHRVPYQPGIWLIWVWLLISAVIAREDVPNYAFGGHYRENNIVLHGGHSKGQVRQGRSL